MSENKTAPTGASVSDFIAGVENKTRRADAETLLAMMGRISGEDPVMWGDTLIGFGQYHYKYDSGREGDSMLTGFAPRKANMVVYIMPGFASYDARLKALGKHRVGKSCLYLNKLEDAHLPTLKKLITKAYKNPSIGGAEIV